MTRRDMMARMGSDELMEWLAFDRICPLPDFYWMAAMLAHTFCQVMGVRGKKLADFLPHRDAPRRQTGPQMIAIVQKVVEDVERRRGKG